MSVNLDKLKPNDVRNLLQLVLDQQELHDAAGRLDMGEVAQRAAGLVRRREALVERLRGEGVVG